METEAYSLRFGEFKAVGKEYYNNWSTCTWLLTIAVVYNCSLSVSALYGNPYSDTRTSSKHIIRRKSSVKNRAVSVKGNFLRHSMSRVSNTPKE